MPTHTTFTITNASPLYTIEIKRTVADAILGPERGIRLRKWWRGYSKCFELMYRLGLVVTCGSWFLVDTRLAVALQAVCLLASTPTIIFRTIFLSSALLRMLSKHYEFCFTTGMNAATSILLGAVLGDARAISSILVFFSYQTTVCIDAATFNVVAAARSSLTNLVCVATICAFAATESIRLRKEAEVARRAVDLSAITLLVNVSMTLTVFVLNKSYKRRKCFSLSRLTVDGVVPLGICFHRLAIRPSDANASANESHDAGNSKVAPLAVGEVANIRCISRRIQEVSSEHTLIARFHLDRRLSSVEWLALQACGALGLLGTLVCFTSILVESFYYERAFVCAMVIALVGTSIYCGIFFVQLEKTLLRDVFRKFDFWFISLQSVAANVCLADMLEWDIRALSLIPWVVWFFWILLQDAVLPTTKRSLRFRKAHAMPLLAAFVAGIGVAAYQLLLHRAGNLKGREVSLVRLSPTLGISFHTMSFLANRLWTIFVTTLRLVYALGWHRDEELMFIRASLEYESSWFDFCSSNDRPLSAVQLKVPASVLGINR